MVGKSQAPMFHGEKPGETKLAPEWTLERVARHAIDFWLSTEDLPRAENRVTVDGDGKLTLSYTATNDGGEEAAVREAPFDARQARPRCGSPLPPLRLHEERDPGGRLRAPGRHLPLRCRPVYVGAERRLPRARARQPLRRRHERLSVHRRGQSGPDRDGQLAARRRPPARAHGAPARRPPRRPDRRGAERAGARGSARRDGSRSSRRASPRGPRAAHSRRRPRSTSFRSSRA